VDPLEKDGGSSKVLLEHRQAIKDLEERAVLLRSAINISNQTTNLTIGGKTRAVADWLVWRREVMPAYQTFLLQMNADIHGRRNGGAGFYRSGEDDPTTNVIVNVDEKALGDEAEELEEILGNLDGQLSLLNATITVEVE